MAKAASDSAPKTQVAAGDGYTAPPEIRLMNEAPQWQSVESLPTDIDAIFFVRANPKANAVLVRYRRTRAVNPENGKWEPFLKIVDARTNLKISFKPREWCPAPEHQPPKENAA